MVLIRIEEKVLKGMEQKIYKYYSPAERLTGLLNLRVRSSLVKSKMDTET